MTGYLDHVNMGHLAKDLFGEELGKTGVSADAEEGLPLHPLDEDLKDELNRIQLGRAGGEVLYQDVHRRSTGAWPLQTAMSAGTSARPARQLLELGQGHVFPGTFIGDVFSNVFSNNEDSDDVAASSTFADFLHFAPFAILLATRTFYRGLDVVPDANVSRSDLEPSSRKKGHRKESCARGCP